MILKETVMDKAKPQESLLDIEKLLREALERIDYGSIAITIHDSKVVQVETSRKVRFNVK